MIDQQIRGLDLAGGDIVLHLRHHHGNDGERFATQVASAIMPGFMICASIWPKPAINPHRPASEG